MVNRENKIAKYKIIVDTGGNRYRFYCEASGAAVCTTKPVKAETPEKELLLAWEEGKENFSLCPRCGRLVCDAMYNADVCECVDCAPWENKPKFCKKCGAEIHKGNVFCTGCGARARYGEVWA